MKRLSFLNPQTWQDWMLSLTIRPSTSRQRPSKSAPVLVIVSVILLTGAFGSRFYNEPHLIEGVKAPETIKAPRDITFEDQEKTLEKMDFKVQEAGVAYQVDVRITSDILAQLSTQLNEAANLRASLEPFPFSDVTQLSAPAQLKLRSLSPSELQKLFQDLQTEPFQQPPTPLLSDRTWTELQKIRSQADQWTQFQSNLESAQKRYQSAINTASILLNAQSKFQVLNMADQDWNLVIPSFRSATRRILTQGIPTGLSPNILTNTVETHLDDQPKSVQALGKTLLVPLLRPNLKTDPIQTAIDHKKITDQVDPFIVQVKQDDLIVRQGQTISREQFLILEQFKLSRRGIKWQGLGIILLGVLAAIASFHLIHLKKTPGLLARRDYFLLLILTLSSPIIVAFSFLEYTSLPAIGLLVGSLYGSVIGGTLVVLIAVVTALGLEIGLAQLFAIAVGSFVGSLLARQPRSREELALLGLIIAVLQGLLYFIFLSLSGGFGYNILFTAIRQGILGLIWSIATLGISPYIEKLFDLVTPIRLAELANPNRPLLKRLAMETPGTFQHTLFVSTLAEAGARALNCNVELVRTGTLYHDIGKMHYPMAFIENQFGRNNVHDQLADPWASAEIIKKHVSEGLVMARKYHLPSAVAAFIPEHQGSILVAFFHHQAQQQSAASDTPIEVNEADFRYPGPIPQSRETGIVMLADACEAALRSLKETNTDLALNTINKIFKARWKDNQLRDSSLTRDDLNVLSQVFVEVWSQFHHQRITYPSQLSTGN